MNTEARRSHFIHYALASGTPIVRIRDETQHPIDTKKEVVQTHEGGTGSENLIIYQVPDRDTNEA